MCGIAGFIDFKNTSDQDILVKMTDSLIHRGPDSSGYELFQTDKCQVGLGHRRLAIIDLTHCGAQPMFTSNRDCVITYNGEIYNYRSIRYKLEQKGYVFNSTSDTEVILYAYKEWGVKAVHEFVGMFAFCIYDRMKSKVFLFADRPGVKPLYYYWDGQIFLFASELKAFHKHPSFKKELNVQSVYDFVQYGYVPAPNAIFKNTYKVMPGHFMEIDLASKQTALTQYWNVYDYYKLPTQKIDEKEALEELEEKLKKACDYRMVSDVPVGLFLSGGLDSSIVAALIQKDRTEKIKTFTIGFHEANFNEISYAGRVAQYLGTDHYDHYCSFEEAKKIIPDLPYFYDEPFGDTSAIPTILLSRFSGNHVKVALSADAGDELFGGYTKYISALHISARLAKLPDIVRNPVSAALRRAPKGLLKSIFPGKDVSKENLDKLAGFIKNKAKPFDIALYANKSATDTVLGEFLAQPFHFNGDYFNLDAIAGETDEINKMLAVDYLSYLPNDILTKVDRATMSCSLEGREPLLDHHLVEWVATLPSSLKIHNGTSKYLLRKLVYKYIPASIMERPKMGFSIPMIEWCRKDLKYFFDDYLNERALNKHRLFNAAKVKEELHKYYEGENNRFVLLWHIFMFQLWYEQWF